MSSKTLIQELVDLTALPTALFAFVSTCHDHIAISPLRDVTIVLSGNRDTLDLARPPENEWPALITKRVPEPHEREEFVWRWKEGAKCVAQFTTVRIDKHNELTTQLVQRYLGKQFTDEDVEDLMNLFAPDAIAGLEARHGIRPHDLVSLAGLLRWSLGNRLGFLNSASDPEGPLTEGVVAQEVGFTSNIYGGHTRQSLLSWLFFSHPFECDDWEMGSAIPPTELVYGRDPKYHEVLNNKQHAALCEAYSEARQEHQISMQEAGHLLRMVPFEWIALLVPRELNEEEKRGVSLMRSILIKFQFKAPFRVRGPVCHLWTVFFRVLDPAFRGAPEPSLSQQHCGVLYDLILHDRLEPAIADAGCPTVPMYTILHTPHSYLLSRVGPLHAQLTPIGPVSPPPAQGLPLIIPPPPAYQSPDSQSEQSETSSIASEDGGGFPEAETSTLDSL